MRAADKVGARWVAVIGENELAKNSVTLRDMQSSKEEVVPRSSLIGHLRSVL